MITEKVPIDMRVNEEKTEQHPQRDSRKMDIERKKHTHRERARVRFLIWLCPRSHVTERTSIDVFKYLNYFCVHSHATTK